MWTFKRTFKEAFDTGGILLFGLGCLFLFRQQYYPNVLGPLSFGMISVGALGFVRRLIKGSSIENSEYQEIISLLQQRQTEIEANRCMLEELRDSCSRFMVMREILEAWQGTDPSLSEERAAILAQIFQSRDEPTSIGSFQEATSEIEIDQLLARRSQKMLVNRALREEEVGVKFDIQEQTGRNFETLKQQVSQVESNIFATLQCLDIENHKKEETEQQYLGKVGDGSKQEDIENICEKVIETDQRLYTGRNSETLKQHAPQVESNISDTLQCLNTEYHRKEETEKQYLGKVGDGSKQEDPENTCQKAIETDIMKQDDRSFKSEGKSENVGAECKPEEGENPSNNLKLDDNEQLQNKVSDQTSEDITFKGIQMA